MNELIRNIEFKIVEAVDGNGVTKYLPKMTYQLKGMLWGWNNREIFIPTQLQMAPETYECYTYIPNLKYHKLIDDGEYIHQKDTEIYQIPLAFTSLSEAEKFIENATINLEQSKLDYQANQLTIKQKIL
jgi:hypothetical protein